MTRVRLVTLVLIIPLVLALLALTVTAVAAWANPDLSSRCAPDDRHYAWTITLQEEQNQILELSFGEDTWQTIDFETAGTHDFLTRQEGSILQVRYADDHNAADESEANKELCGQPNVTPTPEPSPSPTPTPTPVSTPSPQPTPTPVLPDTAVGR